MHRDIKPDNLFLLSDKILLGDFGLSVNQRMSNSIVGTPLYMDPTLLTKYYKDDGKKSYDGAVDIWAAGIIFYEMLTASHPFDPGHSNTQKEFQGQFMTNIEEKSGQNLRFPPDVLISSQTKDILKNILQMDLSLRYTVEKIKKHKCFRKVSEISMRSSQLGSKSQFAFKSVLSCSQMTLNNLQKANVQTSIFTEKNWMDQIEKALENEMKKIEWLDNLNTMVCEYFDVLSNLCEQSGNWRK
jgi:serine/threonine protein kinase